MSSFMFSSITKVDIKDISLVYDTFYSLYRQEYLIIHEEWSQGDGEGEGQPV